MDFGMLTPAFSRISLTSFLMRVVITVVCVIVNTMYSFCIQDINLPHKYPEKS